MSDKILNLNDSNFSEEIKQGLVLVDFWAPWCGPCRMQGPVLDSVAEKAGDKVKIAKVNVDEAGATAVNYAIRSIPTLILFKDGELLRQMTGLQSEEKLLAEIDSAS